MQGRPGRFTVGQLRHRITVQTYESEQDSYGQPIATWSNWLTGEPADYQYTGGGQSLRGRQIEEGIDAVFVVRYRAGHSTHNRVVMGDQTFGIVHVRPIDGRQRYQELYCKAAT